MEVMTISNARYGGVTMPISGYAVNRQNRIILLDLAPNHPKSMGAIWAEMVTGTPRPMALKDPTMGRDYQVYGLGSAYTRLLVDVPQISLPAAGNARARFLRAIHPSAYKVPAKMDEKSFFNILEWPEMSAGAALASMLERDTPVTMLQQWGDALLQRCLDYGYAHELDTAGTAPKGYQVATPDEGWGPFLASGIECGLLPLQ